ncbi:MAG: hypothetical protein AAF446_03850 [Pseudomonadota bacterium]
MSKLDRSNGSISGRRMLAMPAAAGCTALLPGIAFDCALANSNEVANLLPAVEPDWPSVHAFGGYQSP